VQKKRRKKNYSSDVVRVFVLVANRSDGSREGKHKKGIKRGQWIPEKNRGTKLHEKKQEGRMVEDEKGLRDLTEDEKGTTQLGKRMRKRSVQ
jgi:hypothetical protein